MKYSLVATDEAQPSLRPSGAPPDKKAENIQIIYRVPERVLFGSPRWPVIIENLF
jgi:hypothetical protein